MTATGPTRTCRACLLDGRYAGKRTLSRARPPIYENTGLIRCPSRRRHEPAMKLANEVIAGVRRKRLRRHRVQVEIENIDLPRAQTQGAMESDRDFDELSELVVKPSTQHATGQLETSRQRSD